MFITEPNLWLATQKSNSFYEYDSARIADISAALFTSYIISCISIGYIIFRITSININQY